MNPIMENLLALQPLVQPRRAATPGPPAAIRELRESVPAPILAHFDRLVAAGRNGVSLVRHGVCGGCHMRVPTGTAASLLRADDLVLCENCGSYLALAPEEMPATGDAPVAPKPVAVRKPRRKLALA